MFKLDQIVEVDGERWRIVGLGVEQDGLQYAHLASTTRVRQQRNGKVPVQICTWLGTLPPTGDLHEPHTVQ